MHPSAAEPQESVFVNCPYDAAYEPLLRAIVLGIVCCGFTPRCALDSAESSKLRLHRILDALFRSRYSVHDLSRCKGEGDEGLARFNMPLELGMAIARRYAKPPEHDDMLVLVPDGHDYARFISDLAGIDPRKHDGRPAVVLRRIMAWLANYTAEPPPEPPLVEARLADFGTAWADSVADWGELRWWTVVEAAREIAAKL